MLNQLEKTVIQISLYLPLHPTCVNRTTGKISILTIPFSLSNTSSTFISFIFYEIQDIILMSKVYTTLLCLLNTGNRIFLVLLCWLCIICGLDSPRSSSNFRDSAHWFNWQAGVTVKISLYAYFHVKPQFQTPWTIGTS